MVEAALRGESSQAKILAIPDNPSDEVWLDEVIRRVGEFDVVVSNNPWVLSIMKASGYQVFESGLYNRDELEGVKIREMMRAGNEGWKSRVPEDVAREIDVSAV